MLVHRMLIGSFANFGLSIALFAPLHKAFHFQDQLYFPWSLHQQQTCDSRNEQNMSRAAVIALSHGGGPMPVLGDPTHSHVANSLRSRVPDILGLNTPGRPRAIVVVTAHWTERVPHVSCASQPRLLFDYSGFPPESYKLKYDAPGSPKVARQVASAMKSEGLEPQLDSERGWDHGVFIPMILIHPPADIPVVQVSVLDRESPQSHLAMGKALGSLRDDNIAIVASGFATMHNIRLLFSGVTSTPEFRALNHDWSRAVTAAVEESNPESRQKALENWRSFPSAYKMHPPGGAEHFLPLLVAAGAAGSQKAKHYEDDFMGVDMYSYYWQ